MNTIGKIVRCENMGRPKMKGFKTREAALAASRIAKVNPSAIQLPDGSWAGCGEDIQRGNGSSDVMLFGQRGRHAWHSEVFSGPR